MKTNMIYGTVCCALVALCTSAAQAELITFVHTGTGSGTLDGVVFSDAEFSITAIGNTENRQLSSTGNAFSIVHDSASIFINGIGLLDFTVGTRTFVNNLNGSVGFSRAIPGTLGGADIFNGPLNEPVFETWDMLSSVGAIFGSNGRLLQWGGNEGPEIFTDAGLLIFDNEDGITTTFAAIVVPAPAGVLLFGIGGLLGTRRRR